VGDDSSGTCAMTVTAVCAGVPCTSRPSPERRRRGKPRCRQEVAYGLPRQFPTLPGTNQDALIPPSITPCDEWSSQDLVETLSSRLVGRFELLGTQTAEMTVASVPIVKDVDVVSHVGLR